MLEKPILRIIYILLQYPSEIVGTFITAADWMKNGRFQGVVGDRLRELYRLVGSNSGAKKAEEYNFEKQDKPVLQHNLLFFKKF